MKRTLAIVVCVLMANVAFGMPVSITQNLDPTIVEGPTGIPCESNSITTDKTMMRAFDLDGEHGIGGEFCVESLDYAVELVEGSVDVTFAVHCAPQGTSGNPGGFILLEQLDTQFSTTINHSDVELALFNVPLSGCCIAEDSDLVIGITSEDCLETGDCLRFEHGGNHQGQTKPTYLAAPDCGITDPVDLALLGFPDMHGLMVVNGEVEDQDVPATTGLGAMLLLLILLGGSTYILRHRVRT